MRSLFFILVMAAITGCTAQTTTSDGVFEDVSNDRAKEIMQSKADLQILDVRQNAEVARGMIDGAVQMDISKPDFIQKINTLDKTKPVLVYCAAGGRSKTAQEILQENGFKEVYNLANGYESWK